jgi:hypothetical protein
VTPQTDPLAQLHPLREPGAISAWPPAPGWWILAFLLLVAIAVALFLWWRHYRRQAYRREGLRQLDALQRQLEASGDRARFAQSVNALLKAVALRAFPRRQVAAASGEQWLAFLRDTSGTGWAAPDALIDAPYRPEPDLQTEDLHRAAAEWIREHRVPT